MLLRLKLIIIFNVYRAIGLEDLGIPIDLSLFSSMSQRDLEE